MKYKLLVRDDINDYDLLEDQSGNIIIEVRERALDEKYPRLYLNETDKEKCRYYGGAFLSDLASDIARHPERYKDRIL